MMFSCQKSNLIAVVILFILKEACSLHQFSCPALSGDQLPDSPRYYSTNVRFNFLVDQSTVDAREVSNRDEKKFAIELTSAKRHVKYILNGAQRLIIHFDDDDGPTCSVNKITSVEDFFDDEDAGPDDIIQKLAIVAGSQRNKFAASVPQEETGAFLRKWELCSKDPKINVSIGLTEENWTPSRTSSLLGKRRTIAVAEAETMKEHVTALYSNYDPTMPDDTEFQPPENVYCEGFRNDKRPPEMPAYFSYDAEYVVYRSSEGIAPVASHRTIYFDYNSGLIRTDLYNGLPQNQDLFSKVTAQKLSVIQDFKTGTEYVTNGMAGTCQVNTLKSALDVANVSKDITDVPKAKDFFGLNAAKISYNGQYNTRGYQADVYTALVRGSGKIEDKIYTWYFSTNRTQIIGNENIEKNVLLRMVVRPVAGDGKENEMDINFYNFVKEEPSEFFFDISNCFNNSFSKTFVFTFPSVDQSKISTILLKNQIHQSIMRAAGVTRLRIFVSEVEFSSRYMFAEFRMLESPLALVESKTQYITLDEAVTNLKKAVTANAFNVTFTTDNGDALVLKPEPKGLNEYSGDRYLTEAGYGEASVIGVTVGMLVLGFLLGGITINLIVSRKYGVSLFQRTSYERNPLDGIHNESSM